MLSRFFFGFFGMVQILTPILQGSHQIIGLISELFYVLVRIVNTKLKKNEINDEDFT